MLAYTYIEHGKFELREKPEPEITDARDAIVRVTLGSICTSDLHIKHGSVPRAVPGITVGHEMVGVVEEVGAEVTSVSPGDRVTVNVETFCGECFFCHHGYVNNCTDPNGGWALGCRIDGGQAEYVRVPYADQGLNRIPDTVSDEQALFVGDILATGFWATRISEITEKDTVLLIGAGPTGICTLLCSMLKNPKRIIVCEKSPERIQFVREHYPEVRITTPDNCKEFVLKNSDHGGADVVLEVAGTEDSFRQINGLYYSPDTVVKSGQRCLGAFSHSYDNLLVGHVGYVSCRIYSRNRGTAECVRLDFTGRRCFQYIAEKRTVGCQAYLYEDAVQWIVTLFIGNTVLDADTGYLLAVAFHPDGL